MKNNIYLKVILNMVIYSLIVIGLIYLYSGKKEEGAKSKVKFVYQQF